MNTFYQTPKPYILSLLHSLFLYLALPLLVVSCGSETEDTADIIPVTNNDVSEESDADDVGDIVASIESMIATENPANKLSAYVFVDTDIPTTARLEVETEDGELWQTVYGSDEMTASHEILLVGLYAETQYTITAVVDAGGEIETASDPQGFTTGSLPDDFPPIEVIVSDPDRMSPGYTLFSINRWTPGLDNTYGVLIIVDELGQVVWYNRTGLAIADANVLPNGNIAYIFGYHGAAEVNMAGEQVSAWMSNIVGIDAMHHSIDETEEGNILVLGSELQEIDGYLDDSGETTSYFVVGDNIHEFSRDFDMVNTWSMFDYFDPLEIGEGFDDNFWDLVYADGQSVQSTKDWSHANAAFIDPADGNVVVSLRHLDRIIKIDRDTGELLWWFGEGGDFTLLDGGQWQYHQHAPSFTQNGTMLVYDNGNVRAEYEEGDIPYTRVVEYALNYEDMTAEQVWEYRNTEPYHAPAWGDVDELENGNRLITDAGVVADPTQPETEPDNQKWARIIELTPGENPEVVFYIEVKDHSEENPTGYHMYRSNRLQSLYP
jgi:hypothetical protein